MWFVRILLKWLKHFNRPMYFESVFRKLKDAGCGSGFWRQMEYDVSFNWMSSVIKQLHKYIEIWGRRKREFYLDPVREWLNLVAEQSGRRRRVE